MARSRPACGAGCIDHAVERLLVSERGVVGVVDGVHPKRRSMASRSRFTSIAARWWTPRPHQALQSSQPHDPQPNYRHPGRRRGARVCPARNHRSSPAPRFPAMQRNVGVRDAQPRASAGTLCTVAKRRAPPPRGRPRKALTPRAYLEHAGDAFGPGGAALGASAAVPVGVQVPGADAARPPRAPVPSPGPGSGAAVSTTGPRRPADTRSIVPSSPETVAMALPVAQPHTPLRLLACSLPTPAPDQGNKQPPPSRVAACLWCAAMRTIAYRVSRACRSRTTVAGRASWL